MAKIKLYKTRYIKSREKVKSMSKIAYKRALQYRSSACHQHVAHCRFTTTEVCSAIYIQAWLVN